MILALLQARYSSSRLPGKVLKPILGKPMLLHQIERLSNSQMIDKLVVATSNNISDDAIEKMCTDNNIEIFRGDLENVLDRFYQCAKLYNPDYVVRLTGDCPLSDWQIIDNMIQYYLDEGLDYMKTSPKFPDGLDAEIGSLKSKDEAIAFNARSTSSRLKPSQFKRFLSTSRLLVPRILSRRSLPNPDITAITTINAITPSATPPMEIQVLSEINLWVRLALSWRRLTKSS